MALSSAGVIEVRTTGSDNNGGGFKTGATGTDFSQQTAAQFALTNVTTAAANAILLSASAATTMVGNYANVVSGTNFTAGIYEVISVVAGVSITLDRTCTTAAGALGVVNIGGCFATIPKALGIMTVGGLQTWVAATAIYSLSSGLATTAGLNSDDTQCRVIGYSSARGDGGPVTIQMSSAATTISDAVGGFRFENFILDGNSKNCTAVSLSANYSYMFNCVIKNYASASAATCIIGNGTGSGLIQCEITAQNNTSQIVIDFAFGTSGVLKNCYVHNNAASNAACIRGWNGPCIEGNVIANNTGTASDAYSNGFLIGTFCNNTVYNNARDGIRNATHTAIRMGSVCNNIFVSNGGWGINEALSPVSDNTAFHHNAFYNNTSGARTGMNAGTGDVTLTAVPFVNAASNDFRLDNNTGGGVLCRGAGYPGVLATAGQSAGTSYCDIGAIQSQQNIMIVRGNHGG